jgi:hypothetical protein
MMDTKHKLPLGLFKQACMKIDSAIADMNEIREDIDVDDDNKETLTRLVEIAGTIEASLINIIRKECDEEEFLNENIPMDEIDPYPDSNIIYDTLNTPIE